MITCMIAGLRENSYLNHVYYLIMRFAGVFQPRTIIAEQVKGLLTAPDEQGKKGGVFDRFLQNFRDSGYTPYWKIMNAADQKYLKSSDTPLTIPAPKLPKTDEQLVVPSWEEIAMEEEIAIYPV